MKLEARLLVFTIILHHLYIVFLNTSGVHELPVPNRQIWTGLLIIFLLALMYYYLKEKATTWYVRSLYFAIILSVGASLLRSFGFSSQLISYSILLVAIAILTTAPLIIHHHKQLKVMLLAIYSLEIILLVARVFNISNVVQVVGPLIELAIVLGIIYYNYSMGFMFDELFLVIIAAVIGWYLGDFIYGYDVPALIMTTLFEQTLSVGQYSIISGIEPKFFLSLHLAEVFNLIMVQILTGRSWRAVAIVLVGVDMTYPPLMALRAFAILVFIRDTVDQQGKVDNKDQYSKIEKDQVIPASKSN